jgi:hypothetical protein
MSVDAYGEQRLREELRLLQLELNILRQFSDPHDNGCQSPHGGKCSCGWNLIEARLAELRGNETPERIAFLRGSVEFTYIHDEANVMEILKELK